LRAGHSEAGKAGFLAGDVILAIDGKPAREIQDLMRNSGQVLAGGRESMTIIRFQQEPTVKAQLK
jgi:S1-C subfamily serine protease